MFNLQPGQGLGKETSNTLAFGLGSWTSAIAKIMVTMSGPIKKVAHILAFVKQIPEKGFKR